LTMHREVAWGINLAKAPDLVITLLKSHPWLAFVALKKRDATIATKRRNHR
jgi:hypothetical protein